MWVKSFDKKELVNLDKVQYIKIEDKYPTGMKGIHVITQSAIYAMLQDNGDSYSRYRILFVGSPADCEKAFDYIKSKLDIIYIPHTF